MSLEGNWFTEKCDAGRLAFSLQYEEKLHDEQSEFQRIEVYATKGFGNLMVIDGYVMLTQRDNYIYHEMITHPALFTHPNPERVLIIGGGDCGTLREVLKHPGVKKAEQIEIDERVTRISEKYFPELCESNDDPRARLMFIDGIQWVREAEDKSYDVIIVDSTDPIGPAEGLFSKPFFAQCHRILDDNGLIIQQSESPLLHMELISGIYEAMRGGNFVDVMSFFFPQCSYPSGWWTTTMACKDNAITGFREEAAENKTFETRYYNAAMHRAASTAPNFFYQELG
jgi:spermidine synthase